MISAAMSMSRIAIHMPADAAAHQVLGGEREHRDDRQHQQVFAHRRVAIGMPNSSRLPTATEPDGV